MIVGSDGWRNITMAPSMSVTAFIKDASGTPASNVVAYLINTDNSVPQITRVLKSVGGWMSFDAYPGTFTLVVDAAGDSAYVTSVTVTTGPIDLVEIKLTPQTQRTEWVNMTFGADFNSFSLSANTVWSYDDAYPGLFYNDMGSLRAQVDLTMGDGNGNLDAPEIGVFFNKLNNMYTPQYVSTFGLLDVNGTVFANATTVTSFVMDLAPGPVTETDGVNYSYNCQYTSHSPIYVGADIYTADVVARYDSSSVDYNYTIALVNGYELVDNSSTTQVLVSGYPVVTIDPKLVAAGGQESVAMTFQKSAKPVAIAAVDVVGTAYAYAVKDSGGNITRYIVAVNQSVTLTSSESEDPNGNPLTYTWDFGDGSPVNVTRETSVVHNYTSAASRIANLTVTDVVGKVDWSDVSITCDDLAPTPVIQVKDKVVNTTDNSIAINQRENVYFNGTDSLDDAVTAGENPPLGVIDHVEFEWGDGNISGPVSWTADDQNKSHAWERSGTYTVVLNVTDVVGHWKNTTMLVKVNDTEAPHISLVVKNATYGTTLVENKTLVFDANGTYDNVNALTDLSFSWDFGDGKWLNLTGAEIGWNVTHNYTRTGQINVRLNVTDKSNNSNVEVRLITVVSGPRPSMTIDEITYDPGTFTEGKTGYIVVNMTNKGSRNATNIQVSFYIVEADGSQKLIGTSTTVTIDGTEVSVVEPGQTVQVRFAYSPGNKGTYTIRVNVTSADQLRTNSKNGPQLTVEQAAWKQIALWGGVAAVIILVPLLLYLRGRWSKREKKGPRREKKEKEKGSSDEEL